MIIIPMAGLSSRFFDAGFTDPKYKLMLENKTVFFHAVSSFRKFFDVESFMFVCRDDFDTPAFIEAELEKLGLNNVVLKILNRETRGQAETVSLSLDSVSVGDLEPLTIFNIDTFRPNFEYPRCFSVTEVDGYLETFIGSGKNWSNVVPGHGGHVKYTAEKMEVSEYCCTGLYYFKRAIDFDSAFNVIKDKGTNNQRGNELYIAPMYNVLIEQGKDIRFSVIEKDDVVFCGTPDEYNALKADGDVLL